MLDAIKDAVKDFFKFWYHYPMRMLGYGLGCAVIGHFAGSPFVALFG